MTAAPCRSATPTRSPNAIAAEERHAELQQLCADLGVNYLTRERNEHAKAGNLNNGHGSIRTGELIAVFDADHAPARDFLQGDSRLFREDDRSCSSSRRRISSSIPDPLERNLGPSRRCRPRTRCSTASSSAASTNGTPRSSAARRPCLRRKALDETGGFSGISITEDCETAVALHARGWNSVYVDKPLIAGLQPATFASFIGQRSRWAQGMMQILRFRFPLLQARPDRCRSGSATCRRRCSGCSRSRARSSCSRRSSTCSSTWRSSPRPAASSWPTRSPTCS